MGQYRQLERRDLRGFDDVTTALVLDAVEAGAVGRISAKGHAILRGPDGRSTTSVPPNAKKANRGGRNAAASVRRMLGSATLDPVAPTTTQPVEENGMAQVGQAAQFQCDDCPESFDTLKELSGHKLGAHREEGGPATCSICGRSFRHSRALAIHKAQSHSLGETHQAAAGPRNTTPEGAAEVWACDLCPAVYPTRRNMSQHRAAAHREAPKLSEAQAQARRQVVPLHREAEAPSAAPRQAPGDQAARAQAQAAHPASGGAQQAPAVAQPQPGAASPSAAPQDAGAAILARLESQAVELAALRRENADLRAALALVREALGVLE